MGRSVQKRKEHRVMNTPRKSATNLSTVAGLAAALLTSGHARAANEQCYTSCGGNVPCCNDYLVAYTDTNGGAPKNQQCAWTCCATPDCSSGYWALMSWEVVPNPF